MSGEPFVYVTYIASTPEKVWRALTDRALNRHWWGAEAISDHDWRIGTPWGLVATNAGRTIRHVGEVLENEPGKRLVLSWSDVDDKEKPTRVAMEIAEVDAMVRLTITHDDLNASMRKKITFGWPLVLSSLKSFLESGQGLKF